MDCARAWRTDLLGDGHLGELAVVVLGVLDVPAEGSSQMERWIISQPLAEASERGGGGGGARSDMQFEHGILDPCLALCA